MRVARRPSSKLYPAVARAHQLCVSRVRESANEIRVSDGCACSQESALIPASKALSSRTTSWGKESCAGRAAGPTTTRTTSASTRRVMPACSRGRGTERQPARQDADPRALSLAARRRRIDEVQRDPGEPAGALAPRQRAQHQPGLAEPGGPARGAALRHRDRARNFFFSDTAPTEIYTLSLHDALPI